MADWFSTSNQLSERSQEADYREAFQASILAIEAEAARSERERLRVAVEDMPTAYVGPVTWPKGRIDLAGPTEVIDRAAVLALLPDAP